MAEKISMKQVPAGTVTATDDRILYDCLANGKSGVLYGCEISYTGNNMIHINAGYGILKGGMFEIEDHTVYVDYAETGTVPGQIYLHFDAAADDKLTLIKETTASAHTLVQDDDANFDSGIYEIQLCTFNATQTTLTNVTQTFPVIEGTVLDSLEEIAANTTPGLSAGALAVKSLNESLNNMVDTKYDTTTGKPMWKEQGADTWNFFSSGANTMTVGSSPYANRWANTGVKAEDAIGAYASLVIELYGWYPRNTSTTVIIKDGVIVDTKSFTSYYTTNYVSIRISDDGYVEVMQSLADQKCLTWCVFSK